MIKVIAFVLNLFAPFVNLLGLCGFYHIVWVIESMRMLAVVGVFALIGLIFGFRAYKLDIPPRWGWSKSPNQLFSFAISTILGYAMMFAAWPCAICFVKFLIENSLKTNL